MLLYEAVSEDGSPWEAAGLGCFFLARRFTLRLATWVCGGSVHFNLAF